MNGKTISDLVSSNSVLPERHQEIESLSLSASPPLYVDLDGTLLKSDMLWEGALIEVFAAPWRIFAMLHLAVQGRAALKRHLAFKVHINPETLPYNRAFLTWLESQHERGRRLILATASDEIIAWTIANHLGIFEDVIASDGVSNLKGSEKLSRIQARDGSAFEYAGNSSSDLPIWEHCLGAIPVCASDAVIAELKQGRRIRAEFHRERRSLHIWSKLIRTHQWSKNLLVFLPVLAAHKILERASLVSALGMFLSLSLAASATYILNDLHDLAADRQHARKRFRALASGDVTIREGIALAGLLGIAGFCLAAFSGVPALLMLTAYIVISLSYSFWLKRKLLIDVFTLSGLYTLRIIAGGVVTGIVLSGWLLSFSVFLFLSLGFSKRTAEIRAFNRSGKSNVAGRAYRKSDFFQINQFGVASGFLSSLVLALYVGSEQVVRLYPEPAWLWFLVPLVLFWIARLWLLASRGELNEDPVVFALTDRLTIVLAGICLCFGLLATSGVRLGFLK